MGLLWIILQDCHLVFFVFSYVLIFYILGKIKILVPKSMLSMTIFFVLSKFMIWFVAMTFSDFVDLKGFNYEIFNLNLIVNIVFINFFVSNFKLFYSKSLYF